MHTDCTEESPCGGKNYQSGENPMAEDIYRLFVIKNKRSWGICSTNHLFQRLQELLLILQVTHQSPAPQPYSESRSYSTAKSTKLNTTVHPMMLYSTAIHNSLISYLIFCIYKQGKTIKRRKEKEKMKPKVYIPVFSSTRPH